MPILFSRTLNVPHSHWNKRPPTKGAPSSWAWQVLTGSGDVPSAMDSAVRGAGSWDDPWPQWHCSLHARLLSLLGGVLFTSALSVVCLQSVTLNASPFQRRGPFPPSVPGHVPRRAPRDLAPPPVIRWRDQMALFREDAPRMGRGSRMAPSLGAGNSRARPQRGRADPGLGAP